MSHFSVAVAVPANRMSDAEMTDSSILEAILDQIMEPFNESTDFHEYKRDHILSGEPGAAVDGHDTLRNDSDQFFAGDTLSQNVAILEENWEVF